MQKVVGYFETDTGEVHESVTNESGNYTFPDLQPGTYTVTVEAKGFKRYAAKHRPAQQLLHACRPDA